MPAIIGKRRGELHAKSGDNIGEELQSLLDNGPTFRSAARASVTLRNEGEYYTDKPIRMTAYQSLRGLGPEETHLIPTYWSGPLLLLSQEHDSCPHGPALTTGEDYSWNFSTIPDAGGHRWFNLSRNALRPRSLTAFCIKFKIRFHTLIDDNSNSIIYCGGGRDPNDALHPTLSMSVGTGGFVITLTAGGSAVQFVAVAAPVIDTTYDIAIDYSSARGTVLVFLDGVQIGSQAASGSVDAPPHHDFFIGAAYGNPWPEDGLQVAAANFNIGGFVFYSASKHSAGFTPSAGSPTIDADTVLAFIPTTANEEGDLYKVVHGNSAGTGWTQIRRGAYAVVSDCVIQGVGLWGAGSVRGIIAIDAYGCIRTKVEKVYANAVQNGIYAWNNCYLSAFRDIKVLGGGDAGSSRPLGGIVASAGSGALRLDNFHIQGFSYGLVVADSDFDATTGYIIESWQVQMLLQRPKGGEYRGLRIADEGAAEIAENAEYGVLYTPNAVPYRTLIDANIETQIASTYVPMGIAQSGGHIDSELECSLRFYANPSTPELVKFIGQPNGRPVVFRTTPIRFTDVPLTTSDPRYYKFGDGSPNARYEDSTLNDDPVSALSFTLPEDTESQFGVRARGTDQVDGTRIYKEFSFVIRNDGGTLSQVDSDVEIAQSIPTDWSVSHAEAGAAVTIDIVGDDTNETAWEIDVWWGVTPF